MPYPEHLIACLKILIQNPPDTVVIQIRELRGDQEIIHTLTHQTIYSIDHLSRMNAIHLELFVNGELIIDYTYPPDLDIQRPERMESLIWQMEDLTVSD